MRMFHLRVMGTGISETQALNHSSFSSHKVTRVKPTDYCFKKTTSYSLKKWLISKIKILCSFTQAHVIINLNDDRIVIFR